MQQFKQLLDPAGLLNPGKLLPGKPLPASTPTEDDHGSAR
jgi:hypothetical protein